MGINECPACTTCAACNRTYCRDNDVSPREDQGICSDCFETVDERTEDELYAEWIAAGWAS